MSALITVITGFGGPLAGLLLGYEITKRREASAEEKKQRACLIKANYILGRLQKLNADFMKTVHKWTGGCTELENKNARFENYAFVANLPALPIDDLTFLLSHKGENATKTLNSIVGTEIAFQSLQKALEQRNPLYLEFLEKRTHHDSYDETQLNVAIGTAKQRLMTKYAKAAVASGHEVYRLSEEAIGYLNELLGH